jgi:cytoskeletal protein RodZ
MKQSRQKDNDQEVKNPEIPPQIQDNSQENCEKESEEPKPDLFLLKLVITCMVILNLIFAFYAFKSDRFVTQPQKSDSVQEETAPPNPSANQNQDGNQDRTSESN